MVAFAAVSGAIQPKPMLVYGIVLSQIYYLKFGF